MTRLSTKLFFNAGIDQYQRIQERNLELRNQVSTGKKIDKASMDPLVFATAVGAGRDLEATEQFQRNILFMRNRLLEMDGALANGSETMRVAKENLISAGKGFLSMGEREILAQSLEGSLTELMSIANRSDATGKRLFSGIKESVDTFSANTFEYQGSKLSDRTEFDGAGSGSTVTATQNLGQSTRFVEISRNRFLDVGVTGEDAFTFPSTNGTQTDNVFKVLQNAIGILRDTNIPGGQLNSALSSSLRDMDVVYDRTQLARTRLGGRLSELDTVESVNTEAILELQRVITQNIGVDMAAAISELSVNDAQIQAFQQTYARLAQQNLFGFIR